jgi:hypothetical protein
VVWQHVFEWRVCCVPCTAHNTIYNTQYNIQHNIQQYKLPEDGRRPKHAGMIFMCILMQILNSSKFNIGAFVGE